MMRARRRDPDRPRAAAALRQVEVERGVKLCLANVLVPGALWVRYYPDPVVIIEATTDDLALQPREFYGGCWMFLRPAKRTARWAVSALRGSEVR